MLGSVVGYMKYSRWHIANESPMAAKTLREQGIEKLLSSVLSSRDFHTINEVEHFLHTDESELIDPFLLQDMDKAVERISKAIAHHEKVAVYGDYDVDGITSTCIITDYLRKQGLDVYYYIPRRLEDGYGLTCDAIDQLANQDVSLIVTVDCGITALEEVAYASSLGIEIVITDHHECKEELPLAVAVVDPQRKDCAYPFKHLAGVGVAFKLVLALEGKHKQKEMLDRYSDLVAIGTVADVMKLVDENRFLVQYGIQQLRLGKRMGLDALFEEMGTDIQTVNSITIGYLLAPRINATGRMGEAQTAVELILTDDDGVAKQLAQTLCQLNRDRQAVELSIFEECIDILGEDKEHQCIIMASDRWHQGVVGIVASRLAEKYASPAFMITLEQGYGKGSCRSYGGFHLFSALEACSELLEGYGGHALAAGFTIKEENIPAFREKMSEQVQKQTKGQSFVSTLDIDVEISEIETLSVYEVSQLSKLEPYGNGNEKPSFVIMDVHLTSLIPVGGGRHLKLRVAQGDHSVDAIFFGATKKEVDVQVGERVDVAFYPQINTFRGNRSAQLQVLDLRPSEKEKQEILAYERFLQGEAIDEGLAERILPRREEFVVFWRHLMGQGGQSVQSLQILKSQLQAQLGQRLTQTRLQVCLDVLEQSNLISIQGEGSKMKIASCAVQGKKMNLEDTNIMRRLRHTVN